MQFQNDAITVPFHLHPMMMLALRNRDSSFFRRMNRNAGEMELAVF